MRLSNLVNQNDVDQAINLIKVATQQAATDPQTGLIDMDVILMGKSTATRQRITKIKNKIQEILKANINKYKKASTMENLMPEI